MKPMHGRTQSGSTAGQPAPRKRFRIAKLEERIAPIGFRCKGHLNPQGKWVGGYLTGCAG